MTFHEQMLEKSKHNRYRNYVKKAKKCAVTFGCSFMSYEEFIKWENENKAEGK